MVYRIQKRLAVAGKFVPGWLYNIGTTVLNGGVSMVVFFFVNKIIFPEGVEERLTTKKVRRSPELYATTIRGFVLCYKYFWDYFLPIGIISYANLKINIPINGKSRRKIFCFSGIKNASSF